MIQENKTTYKIYQYTFPNGLIYIGMTKNSIQGRRDCGYQHNERLRDAIRRYGWKDVKTTILEEGLSLEDACKAEKSHIMSRQANDENIGYNISYGGKDTFSGLKHTEEYKQYMSRMYKGRSFSKETIERMKTSHKKERRPVRAISEDETVTRFESLGDAAESVAGHKANIVRAIASKKSYKGFFWEDDERG